MIQSVTEKKLQKVSVECQVSFISRLTLPSKELFKKCHKLFRMTLKSVIHRSLKIKLSFINYFTFRFQTYD